MCGFCCAEPCECKKHVPYADRVTPIITHQQVNAALINGGLTIHKTSNIHANLGKHPAYVLAEQLNKLLGAK